MKIKLFERKMVAKEDFAELEREVNSWLEKNSNIRKIVAITPAPHPSVLAILVQYEEVEAKR